MTYSGNPSTSLLDEVRFLIGDTDDPSIMSDDEINYLLNKHDDNAIRAAYAAVIGLISRYSKKMDKSIGQTRLQYAQLVQQWRDLLKTLGGQGGATNASRVGGPTGGDSLDRPLVFGRDTVQWHQPSN